MKYCVSMLFANFAVTKKPARIICVVYSVHVIARLRILGDGKSRDLMWPLLCDVHGYLAPLLICLMSCAIFAAALMLAEYAAWFVFVVFMILIYATA